MFSEKGLNILEKVDKYVSEMNEKVSHPYFFTWSFPTNHRHTEITEISYFSIDLGKYLIQETEENIERCTPVSLLYFFGQIQNIEHCIVPDNIADFWNKKFTEIISKNYFALDNAARGYHNINNSEFNILIPKNEQEVLEKDAK